jgi:hypothetical protein
LGWSRFGGLNRLQAIKDRWAEDMQAVSEVKQSNVRICGRKAPNADGEPEQVLV